MSMPVPINETLAGAEPAQRADASRPRDPSPAPGSPVLPAAPPSPEVGGPTGPEPTRYGDWERRGRCIDF
jgi:hypothetical protein